MTPQQDAFIRRHLRLVRIIARRFPGSGLPFEDLVGFGHIGLCQAAISYDGRSKEAYWAASKIQGAIQDGIRAWRGRECTHDARTDGTRTRRLRSLPDPLPDTWEPQQPDFAPGLCATLDLHAALMRLPKRRRMAVYAAGLGYAQCELAAALGVSEHSVSVWRTLGVRAVGRVRSSG